MKRLPMMAAALLVGLTLTTPAHAGHFGRSRGRRLFVESRVGFVAPVPHAAFSLEFGYPGYYPYGPYYYAPAPAYYYEPYPPVVGPVCAYPVWVPPRYAWRHGARFYISGHWSR